MVQLLLLMAVTAAAVLFVELFRRNARIAVRQDALDARLRAIERGERPAAAAPPLPAAIHPATTDPATTDPVTASSATPSPATPAPADLAEPAPGAPLPAELSPPAAAPSDDPIPARASPPPARTADRGFEQLIGARLPIWVGGAALVLAGFFLVRYSIELGLLGPAMRSALAAIFAVALLIGGEVARSLPATRDDPRIAQVFAGAGVASAYGTLYMAAALYHLIAPLPAFAIMIGVTAIGLALSLRHGPPTAIMALVGGFVAPLVAGYDAAGIAPLLVYLALFTASLFGLALRQRWIWLIWASFAASLGWAAFLTLFVADADLAPIGAFVIILAVGATLALPADRPVETRLRLLPVIAAILLLAVLGQALEFGPLAWSYVLTMSAVALGLAWRDDRMLPGAGAALVLVTLLIAAGMSPLDPLAALIAAAVITALFGGVGSALSHRGRGWQALAVLGLAGPFLAARAVAPHADDAAWAGMALALAAICAWLSWRHRADADRRSPALIGGAASAALLGVVGLQPLATALTATLPGVAALIGLALWGRRSASTAVSNLAIIPAAALIVLAAPAFAVFADIAARSLTGDPLPYARLAVSGFDVARLVAFPALATLGLALALPTLFGRLRRVLLGIEATLLVLAAYWLLKQPLAIATPARFVDWGFVERALLTQLCLGIGWALNRRGIVIAFARALMIIGLARLIWFDLLILDPLFVAQRVGGVPILNAAVVHLALAALWCRLLGRDPWPRLGAIGFAVAAALVAVRQLAHGSVLTGPVTTPENWGYSAALLALAIAMLWYGIRSAGRGLRLAGLAMLTVATLKVFLIDAAALDGILRIASFLALGFALIAIGWAYRRFIAIDSEPPLSNPDPFG